MRHLYLTKEFSRLARRQGVAESALKEAVERAEKGLIDADLGGNLVKQRVARPGEGRSGGFRTILAYRRGKRAIFLHMFAKSQRANLSAVEVETYQALARELDKLDESQLAMLVKMAGWRRIELG